MKRILALLLVLSLVFAFAGCGDKDTTSGADENKPTNSQEETSSTDDKLSEPTSTDEENDENENKPADDTNNNTQAHTHNFTAATCLTPKKCACGVTEGEKSDHLYTAEKCPVCKTNLVIDFEENYKPGYLYSKINKVYDANKISKVGFGIYGDWGGPVCDIYEIVYTTTPNDSESIIYNGKKWYIEEEVFESERVFESNNSCGMISYDVECDITGEPYDDIEIEFVILKNKTVLITKSNHPFFKKGDILQ